jgi:hypothetical protein
VDVARNQPQQAAQAADAAAARTRKSGSAHRAVLCGSIGTAARRVLGHAPRGDSSRRPVSPGRLAEVEFYLGNIAAARSAAERAITAAPALSRPRSILGFVELAQFRIAAAEDAFRAAATLDPADPLPRLGSGSPRSVVVDLRRVRRRSRSCRPQSFELNTPQLSRQSLLPTGAMTRRLS